MKKMILVGNPNSGKTTVFNGLTGSNQSVGNWPGVTVERKSGLLKLDNYEAEIIDLPGIYSLSTLSLEEEITRDYILKEQYDVIINVVDASNLERNLFLTNQLLELHLPIVIALNCMDLVQKKLDLLDTIELERLLGVPVIPITASKKHGIHDLTDYLASHDVQQPKHEIRFSADIEEALIQIEEVLQDRTSAIRYFEDREKSLEKSWDKESKKQLEQIAQRIQSRFQMDLDMILPKERYDRIMDVCQKVLKKSDVFKLSTTDKIDKILTHKFLGLPIFVGIMFSVFFFAFGPVGTFITDYFVLGIDTIFSWIRQGVEALGMSPWVSSLITNGVFGGLAAVVGFLPQLMILFFFMALLEDSGYMARAAFLMDRILRNFGLSGKAFIPMLIGFGCSVPAITATRTLDHEEDRKITSMVIPFISCGAKAPIYGVFAGALFAKGAFIVVFSMYFLGIIVAILSAILFKKTLFRKASQNYLMELPEYRMPSAKNMWLHTWERSKGFLIKAGTILLSAFVVIWFLSYFGFVDGKFQLLTQDQISMSLLASIGRFVLPLFQPLGFTDWESTVAILTGFVAKESVVGTLGILYGVSGNVIENGSLLFSDIQAHFTSIQALSFMTFALLATPCIATLAALKRELGSWKWLTFIVLYELVVAYLVAMLVFQLGSLGIGTILSTLFLVVVVWFVLRTIIKVIKNKGKTCENCNGCGSSEGCHLPKKLDFEQHKEAHDDKTNRSV